MTYHIDILFGWKEDSERADVKVDLGGFMSNEETDEIGIEIARQVVSKRVALTWIPDKAAF